MNCMIVGKTLMISPEGENDVTHFKMMIHNKGGWKINIKTTDVGDQQIPTALLLEPGDNPDLKGDGVTDEERVKKGEEAKAKPRDFTKGDAQGNVVIRPGDLNSE